MLAFNQTLSNRPQLVFGEWRSYMGWGFSLRGSSPGRSGGGREKVGELATTFLNLNSTSNSPVAPSRAVRFLPISAKRKLVRMYYFIEEEEKHLRIDTFTITSQKIRHPRVIKTKITCIRKLHIYLFEPVYFNRAVSVISWFKARFALQLLPSSAETAYLHREASRVENNSSSVPLSLVLVLLFVFLYLIKSSEHHDETIAHVQGRS